MKTLKQRLPLLGVLFALTLAACGGGGAGAPGAAAPGDAIGGASASGPNVSAPAPAPAPAASPSPGSPAASTPGTSSVPAQAETFQAFAPTTMATSVEPANGNGSQPAVVSRLAGGGGVTVWSSGGTLLAQRFGPGGAATGPQITVSRISGSARNYALTALANGSWVVLWVDGTQTAPSSGRQTFAALQFKRYSAAGDLLQDTTAAAGPFLGIFPRVQARATADAGFVIAWSSNDTPSAPTVAFQRFDATGAKSGGVVNVAGLSGAQTLPYVLALPDNSLELLWLQASTANATRTVTMQHFDALSNMVGAAVAVEQSTAPGDYEFTAAVLADGRIAIAWDRPRGAVRVPLNASWAISNAAGTVQTAGAMQTDVASSSVDLTVTEGLDIAPSANGGFTLFSQTSTSSGSTTTTSINVLAVDSTGTPQQTWASLVSRITVDHPASNATPTSGPADLAYSVSGAVDGHYLLSYEAAITEGAAVQVLGR